MWRGTRPPGSQSVEPRGGRVDDLAGSQLTDEQYERYEEMVGTIAGLLPSEGFTKTLDAVYASPRAKKLDYLSLNVYEPFGVPAVNRATRIAGSSGSGT